MSIVQYVLIYSNPFTLFLSILYDTSKRFYMNPTQLQSDSDNDVHSLEGGTSVVENGSSPSPLATAPGEPQAPKETPNKVSLFRRIWSRFNIYLLLFAVVLLGAIAVVVFLTVKDRSEQQTANEVISQNLSSDTLQQLANSDSTIGNPKQILNIESNAIFSGTVLVRKDLEVAGSIRVNGALALPGITVSGSSNFNQIQASSLNLSGAATINGPLTARNGLSVNGTSNFSGAVNAPQITTGTLQLNGELVLTNHITAGGPIPGLSQGSALGSGGTASLSGSDTSGSITINTGSGPGAGCFVTVTFNRAFSNTPHVVATPVGAAAAALTFYVNRSTTNFSVCTTTPAPTGQTFGFDYIALN